MDTSAITHDPRFTESYIVAGALLSIALNPLFFRLAARVAPTTDLKQI